MTEHPLTDEICCQLWQDNKDNWLKLQEPCPATRRVMRAAYDVGRDAQLEQAIEWLKDNVSHSLLLDITDKGRTYPNTSKNDKSLFRLDLDWIAEDLREAMRPTTKIQDN